MPMNPIFWELSVLGRAIHFPNLSSAAANIGISQPQLSRIIKKIETELNTPLLSRESRRNSHWTPSALKIAEAYLKHNKKIGEELEQITQSSLPKKISIGFLEGLMPLAAQLGQHLLKSNLVTQLEMDVFDLSMLEETFLRGDLDVVLTARTPGRKKYNHVRTLGYQRITKHNVAATTTCLTLFESTALLQKSKDALKSKNVIVSNSLALKKYLVEEYKISADIPSELHSKAQSKDDREVLLLASPSFPESFWVEVDKFQPSAKNKP